jgi:hypothetical protein
LESQITKHGGRPPAIRPEYTAIGDDKIIGSTLVDSDGRRQERFQVLTIRDGKIVDMQGCRSRREAERFARRRR